jgi:hypothetical protein
MRKDIPVKILAQEICSVSKIKKEITLGNSTELHYPETKTDQWEKRSPCPNTKILHK